MHSLAIVGSSISAKLAAAHLRKRFPDLRVVMIGPTENKQPIVGESVIEPTVLFLRELGLSRYLVDYHYPKFGLTFLYKKKLGDPTCREYIVHESETPAPLPAYLINRSTFDPKLDEVAHDLGVERIAGKVDQVETLDHAHHRLSVTTEDGTTDTVQANWLIDASGRSRLLAKRYRLHADAPVQRSAFWFRIQGFDRDRLFNIDADKRKQYHFDPYFTAHHFLGRGYWVWCIPMRTAPGEPALMSIGITWRPDLFQRRIRSVADFCTHMQVDHPVLAELVESGSIVDQHLYNKYMYRSKQLYSPDGWYLIGDAGHTVDPLYSTGMSITTLQIEQIAEMIDRDRRGCLTADYVHALEQHISAAHGIFHRLVSRHYEVMHDPYPAAWNVSLMTIFFFYVLMPSWFSRYHVDPVGARLLVKLIDGSTSYVDSLLDLVDAASRHVDRVTYEDIPNEYMRTVNFGLRQPVETDIPAHVARGLWLFTRYRFRFLKAARGHDLHRQLRMALGEIGRATALRTAFRHTALTRSRLVQAFVGARTDTEAVLPPAPALSGPTRRDVAHSMVVPPPTPVADAEPPARAGT